MAKYIELEDAYRTLSDYYHHSTDNQHMSLREALDRVPAADVVERKTGKWIYDSEPYPLGNPYGHYGCDQCGESVPARTNFCPNCGAKMEVPTDV